MSAGVVGIEAVPEPARHSAAVRPYLAVAALLGLALAIRLGLLPLAGHWAIREDEYDYHRIAISIAHGHGYPPTLIAPGGGPSALRPPAYPFLLAGLYSLFGVHVAVARIMQALLGTITVALIGLLAWQLAGRRAACLALAIAAVYPSLALLPATLLSENLYVPLLLGAVAAVLASRRSQRRTAYLLLAGLLVGLSILTRQNGAIVLLALALGALGPHPTLSRRTILPVLAMLAAAILVVAPWTIRNGLQLHRFVPVATQSGLVLAGTYNDQSRTDPTHRGGWRPPNRVPRYAALFHRRGLGEAALDAKLRASAISYAERHPFYIAQVGFWNMVRIAQLGGGASDPPTAADQNLSLSATKVSRYGFYVLAVLALVALALRGWRAAPRWLWLVPVLLATSVFLEGLVRYRMPIDAFLILLVASAAAGAGAGGYRTYRSKRGEAATSR